MAAPAPTEGTMAEDEVLLAVPVEEHPDHPLHQHHHIATRAHLSLEHDNTRAHVASEHENTRSLLRSSVETAQDGILSRLDAIHADIRAMRSDVVEAVAEPETTPEPEEHAAEDVVEVPADVIEPPAAEEEEPEKAARRGRRHRR